MLVYKSKFLTIDGRRNDCNGQDRSSLFLTYTIQCNGELRRYEQTIYLSYKDPKTATTGNSSDVDGWSINEHSCYDVIRLIRALGYEIEDEGQIVKHAMKQWYTINPMDCPLQPLNEIK